MTDDRSSNERLNVSDQSTADPMIKLRRFLIDLSTREASSCFHADGFPRQALSRDAAEFVKVLDANAQERAEDLDRMERAAETIERLTLEFQAASQQAAELRDSRAKYMDICEKLSRELDHLKRRHANLQEAVRT